MGRIDPDKNIEIDGELRVDTDATTRCVADPAPQLDG